MYARRAQPETDGERKIEGSYQGLYRQMVELFKKMGIEAVPTARAPRAPRAPRAAPAVSNSGGGGALRQVGKPFDPAVHEAIQRVSGDVAEETVSQEFRKGFRIGGKLIRPAMVAVTVPGVRARGATLARGRWMRGRARG